MLTFFQNIFTPPRHLILLVLASWLGLVLAERHAERTHINKENLNNLTFYMLIAFMIGGRISYILQHLSAFTKSPLSVFAINLDLFDVFGAIAIAIVTALVYGQRKELPFWDSLDALTPFFAILAIGLGLSHLAAGTAFGKPTDLPWGIDLWNAKRHPTQIYETFASILTFCLIWFFQWSPRSGVLFLMFAAWTSFWQLFLQAFRADNAVIFGGMRQEQILAWVALALSFVLLEVRFKVPRKNPTHTTKSG